jgi:hypothetical protein
METVINVVIIAIFTTLCCFIISEGLNKDLLKELDKQKQLNNQIMALYQNERDKTDTLYRIIFHIRQQLSLLKLKECPEEEFKNIPFEIIDWIDMLEKVNNGDENVK